MKPNRTIAKKLVITYLVAFAGLAQAKSGEVTTNTCGGGEVLSSVEIAPQQIISTSKYSAGWNSLCNTTIFDSGDRLLRCDFY